MDVVSQQLRADAAREPGEGNAMQAETPAAVVVEDESSSADSLASLNDYDAPVLFDDDVEGGESEEDFEMDLEIHEDYFLIDMGFSDESSSTTVPYGSELVSFDDGSSVAPTLLEADSDTESSDMTIAYDAPTSLPIEHPLLTPVDPAPTPEVSGDARDAKRRRG
jgi:hypothetical protein